MQVSGGPAEAGFVATTQRWSAVGLGSVQAVVGCAALLVVPEDRRWGAIATILVLLGWTVATCWLLRRGPASWVLRVGVALLVAACLLQPVLEVPELMREECGWIVMTAEAALVVHQWQFRRGPALRAAALVIAAYVVGAVLTAGWRLRDVLLMAVWLVAVTVVSQLIFSSMIAVTRRIDAGRSAADLERLRIEVARAVREAQAEHLATLHDTVAATLLMIGTGADADGTVMRRQAARDLAVLTSPDPDLCTDLGARLRGVVDLTGLRVALTGAAAAPLPPTAVDAVAGAVGEALRNVERHAGTDRAAVHVRPEGAGVLVEVRDDGGGFAPGSRHGQGIRQSIVGRMERAGGTASVTTTPGGVQVSLVWKPRRVRG